jgi:hypothetical protein
VTVESREVWDQARRQGRTQYVVSRTWPLGLLSLIGNLATQWRTIGHRLDWANALEWLVGGLVIGFLYGLISWRFGSRSFDGND